MVRVLGNSPERVRIADLGDVIYYRQRKDYSDQEYESSRDLQREIRKGRVTVLERSEAVRGSTGSDTVRPQVDLGDIKQAIREVLPEVVNSGQQDPSIVSMVKGALDAFRQELGPVVRAETPSSKAEPSPEFSGPEYVPDISTDGMVSNVKADEREVSGGDVDDALQALRDLNK